MKNLVIIPARGGSKGIPRKNLRPLSGNPLIFYSIQAAIKAHNICRVVVSTDDEEIALFAKRFGAEVIMRPKDLADDTVPLDPVVLNAVETCETKWEEKYDLVITVQPTSPLITSEDINSVINKFNAEDFDTIISVCEDKHLRWKEAEGKLIPTYEERVNRQFLPNMYKETGAIIACKRSVMRSGKRIGVKIGLYKTEPIRSIDIDSYNELWLCEQVLERKKIIFTVIGNKDVGMGHVYRVLMLANELIHYDISFVCKKTDDIALDYIKEHNYKIKAVSDGAFVDTIICSNADLVINDILDTSADYVVALKKAGLKVVNIEDLGLGAEVADMVFNALYPYTFPHNHIFVGPEFFCLRDEFLHISLRERRGPIKSIFISFGGVDEGNLTCRVLKIIKPILDENNIKAEVILGPGYMHHEVLDDLIKQYNSNYISIISSTKAISEYMNRADIAITSAGRTVFELASLGLPTIVIAQNLRETMHTVASSENGLINLGLRTEIEDDTIYATIKRLINNSDLRITMQNKMRSLDLRNGKKRLIKKIKSLLSDKLW